MTKTPHLPISNFGHIHKLIFFQLSSPSTSKLPPLHHLFPSGTLAAQGKYQVSGKCLCRLKPTCKMSSASLVLKPHAVKLSSLPWKALNNSSWLFWILSATPCIIRAAETPNSSYYFSSSLQRLWPIKRPKRELSSNRFVLQFEMWDQHSHIVASIPLARQVCHS